jgi:hypothetical protein
MSAPIVVVRQPGRTPLHLGGRYAGMYASWVRHGGGPAVPVG